MKNDFTPDRLFLKGWSPFVKIGNREGLSAEDCEILAKKILDVISPGLTGVVDRPNAPYFRNHQIAIFLKHGTPKDSAWQLCRAINDLIKVHGWKALGRDIAQWTVTASWHERTRSSTTPRRGAI